MHPLWKTIWIFLNRLKIEQPYDPVFHFWVYIQWKWSQYLKEISVPPCSLQHHSQQPRYGKQPKDPPTDERIKKTVGASLVAQWLRIRLLVQGTWVRALVQEDPTCRGAAKPVHHDYWACTLEPTSHNYWAHMPQLLKPMHLEPMLRHKRGHRGEKPTHRNKE